MSDDMFTSDMERPDRPPMIRIMQLSRYYGMVRAVDDLSLDIPDGAVFGLIGSNGAGKTTVFRYLATLIDASNGGAFINGYSVSKQPKQTRRSIGYMPDELGLYPGMRVWEFLDFFAASYRIPRWRRENLISDLLSLMDLEGKRFDPVDALSRGMKQRLGLARALVHDPPVLILDEPASGLDPRARLEVKELLRELTHMGKTILISSHILSELADLITHIGFLERGKLLASGELDEVLEKVRDYRVYRMQLIEGADLAHQMLQENPRVFDLQTGSNEFTYSFKGDPAEAAEVLEAMVEAGVRICGMAEKPIDLEEAFFKLTKGEVQ